MASDTNTTADHKNQHSTREMEVNDTTSTDETVGNGRGTNLHDSPMMIHLLDALEAGEDIGHFGRLTFVMVARFFLPEDEIVNLLEQQPGMSEEHARALVLEVKERDYNPPKRNQILEWQHRQSFPICPNAEDTRSCNVYSELQFPDSVYENITRFYEQQVEAEGHHDSGEQPSA